MDFTWFEQRIIDTVIDECTPLAIMWCIILVLLIIEVIVLFTRKTNQGVNIWNLFRKKPRSQHRLTLKQQIAGKIAALILVPVWLGFANILPAYNDITNQQYIEYHGTYSRQERTYKSKKKSPERVEIIQDGEKILLYLPAEWNSEEFPLGDYYGTIWYSQDSKIILSFQPDN